MTIFLLKINQDGRLAGTAAMIVLNVDSVAFAASGFNGQSVLIGAAKRLGMPEFHKKNKFISQYLLLYNRSMRKRSGELDQDQPPEEEICEVPECRK